MKTPEQIKQAAEYAAVNAHPYVGSFMPDRMYAFKARIQYKAGYIAGAESILSEVERLEEENKALRERINLADELRSALTEVHEIQEGKRFSTSLDDFLNELEPPTK